MERTPEQWKKVADDFKWDSDLDDRWQTDEDLFLMEPYQWPTSEGKIVQSRDYVTLNAARYFADRVIDTIKFSDEQIVVEEGIDGEIMNDKDASPIENFIRLNFELADQRLDRAEMLPARAAAAGHMVVRGRALQRILVYSDGTDYYPDVQWYDPRYSKYGVSKSGVTFAMPVMERSGDDIYDEYGYEISGKTAKVSDLWTKQDEYVYINNELVQTLHHGLGYVPFVPQIVPLGGYIQTEGKYFETIGESVYGPVRDLYPVLNKLLTILMTYTRLSIEGAYQYQSMDPEGEKERVQKSGYPVEPGKVTIVDAKGGGYHLIEVPDIRAATQYLLSQIEVSLQRATLPFLDYGQTPFELSGSAMLMIKGAGDIIYIPRMAALANMSNNKAWMLIDQYKKGGIRVDLGEGPYKYKMIDRKLDGDYKIKFKYVPNLPEKDLANLHLAAAMKELGASQDTIFRDYLQMDDPDGERQKTLRERAESMIQPLWLRDAAQGEINRGDNTAADIIALQLDMSLEELMSGEVVGAKPMPEQRQASAFFPQREAVKQQGAVRPAQMPQQKEVMV